MQTGISAPQTTAPADDEIRRMLAAIHAQMQASLALSRATLCALAAVSPVVSTATDAALEEEIDALQRLGASTSRRVMEIIDDAYLLLQRIPARRGQC